MEDQPVLEFSFKTHISIGEVNPNDQFSDRRRAGSLVFWGSAPAPRTSVSFILPERSGPRSKKAPDEPTQMGKWAGKFLAASWQSCTVQTVRQ